MFVAVPDPGVQRLAVVQGANKCMCDRLSVGRDGRSRPTFIWSQYAFIRTENDYPSSDTWVSNCNKQSSWVLWASSLLVSCI